MKFADPYFLVLIPLLFIGFRFFKRRNERPYLIYPIKIPKAFRIRNPVGILMILRIVGLVFLTIALARPQNEYRQAQDRVAGIDIILVMDLSASMNIEDLAQTSRLDVAKKTMTQFIKGRSNDRIGLIVFSGEPLTLAPPTLDYGLVLQALRGAEIGVLKDGTAIGDGLTLAVSRLKESEAKSKVIILLTDGDNNIGRVDPGTAGELAKGYGIKAYTIAVGREGRVRLPIRRKGAFGNTVTTYQWFDNALNPKLLKKIATMTDGKFYRVTDASTLEQVFQEIDQLEKDDQVVQQKIKTEDQFELPLILGFLFLVLEKTLSLFWWRFRL